MVNKLNEYVQGWVVSVLIIATAAKEITSGRFCEQSFLQRVMHPTDQHFQSLCEAICKHFYPALF